MSLSLSELEKSNTQMATISETSASSASSTSQTESMSQSEPDVLFQAMESIKLLSMTETTRSSIIMADLDKIHELNFSSASHVMEAGNVKIVKYDSVFSSAAFSLSSLIQYKFIANIIAFVFEYDWSLTAAIISLCISSALNSRAVFMQSGDLGEFIVKTPVLKTVLLQLFYYKGMLDYSLMSAIGHLLLESNMFSKIAKVKEYKNIIKANSLLSAKIKDFPENTRSNIVVSLIRRTLDMKKITSLCMIINGFINVSMTKPIAETVKAFIFYTPRLASANFKFNTVILTMSFFSDEQIVNHNKTSVADDQYQIDNITRGVEGRSIIVKDLTDSDYDFLANVTYSLR